MEERFAHVTTCIKSLLNGLAFDQHGLDGGTRENLITAWYDVHGDNVRHALDQVWEQARSEALSEKRGTP